MKHNGLKTVVMMIALALLLALSSCSANWHLKKAIAKDPSILTEGKVIERVTDSIMVRVADTTFTVDIEVPEERSEFVAPLSKLITYGFTTLENDRHIVTIEIDAQTDQITVNTTTKERTLPTSVTLLGRSFTVPYSFDRVTIKPEVRTRHGPWISVAIFIAGLFLGYRLKHPKHNQ